MDDNLNIIADVPETGNEPAERTYTRAEVDQMIDVCLRTARETEEARLQAARAEGRDEAERLGRMTAEERLNHEREAAEEAARARRDALDEREAAITRRELRAEAQERLAEHGLPQALRDCLDYSSGEALDRSLLGLERAFRSAVQAGIDARLSRGGVRLTAGPAPDPAGLDDSAYYAAILRAGR